MSGVRRHIPTLDEAEQLGAALVEVNATMLRHPPGHRRRWFTGPEPYLTVSIESSDAGIDSVEVSFRGRFARRSRGEALQTGETDELDISSKMPEAKLEHITQEQPQVIAVAQRILEARGLRQEAAWLVQAPEAPVPPARGS